MERGSAGKSIDQGFFVHLLRHDLQRSSARQAMGTSSSDGAAVRTCAGDAGVADGKAFQAKLREEPSKATWGPEAAQCQEKRTVSQEA